MCRVLIDVWKEDSLGEWRFDVFTGTTVSVSAGSDLEGLEVEGKFVEA